MTGSFWCRHTPLADQQHPGAPAGSKGNKTEQSAPLLFSVLLSLPMIVFFVYYLQFQTYV